MRAAEAVAEGRADALVSGGSTGAALAAALFRFKRAPACTGRRWRSSCRCPKAPFLLLDAGANVEVRPEHLVQFAHMGAAFMEVVMGVERPRVALLSNGEEPSKGTEIVVAAHAALREQPGELNFIGNVEGFAIGTGAADVIVADGFAGNVDAEGHGGHVGGAAGRGPRRGDVVARARKLGGLLLRPGAARRCATRSTRRSRAAPCCSACAGSASCRTARSARAASRARSRSRRAACGWTWPAGPTTASPAAGALRVSEPAATVPDQP